MNKEYIQPYLGLKDESHKIAFVDDVVASACTCQQVISAVHRWVLGAQSVSQEAKARTVMLVCDTECNLFEGGRDDLNLMLFFEKLKVILLGK